MSCDSLVDNGYGTDMGTIRGVDFSVNFSVVNFSLEIKDYKIICDKTLGNELTFKLAC